MKTSFKAIISLFFILPFFFVPDDAFAMITLRTSAVETINSITPETSVIQTITQSSSSPMALYALTFSLSAFESPVAIPKHIFRKTEAKATTTLSFVLEDRKKKEMNSGFAVASLVATGSSSDTTEWYVIPAGQKRSFTALIAYTDPRTRDPEGRMRITELPLLVAPAQAPILLNQSELSKLKTKFAELY